MADYLINLIILGKRFMRKYNEEAKFVIKKKERKIPDNCESKV